MKWTVIVLTVAWLIIPAAATTGSPVTEDFEDGFADGQPLRVHADWFFGEQKGDPNADDEAGTKGGWGVAPGDRPFAWVANPFNWNDPELVSVTVGADWQTDAEGRLDDDRAGWSISNEDDSSSNIFGVQIDPGGSGESGINIEAYWDGENFGDDSGRTSIVDLPKLDGDTWYRLRAKITKLTDTSAKIKVTFVKLDDDGEPTGDVVSGTLDDTAALSGTPSGAVPNEAYFTPTTVWPVFKNYGRVIGGFDNAYFEIEKTSDAAAEPVEAEPADTDPKPADADPEPADADPEPASDDEPAEEPEPPAEPPTEPLQQLPPLK